MTIAVHRDNLSKLFHVDPVKGGSYSYQQILSEASAIYGVLKERGVVNSTILLSCKQYSHWMPSLLACWMAGIAPAIIPAGSADEVYLKTLGDYQLAALLCDFPVTDAGLAEKAVDIRQAGAGSFTDSFEVDGDAVALLLFSSGTSGKQKCIPLSFNNLLDNIHQFAERLGLSADTSFLCASPLYHAHGLYNSFLTAFFLKASVIYGGQLNMLNIHPLFSYALSVPDLTFHITPSMIPIMLEYISRNGVERFPRFRNLICGTAFLDSSSKQKIEHVSGTRIYQQYGMTETLFMSINDTFSSEKPLSVGRPLSGVQLEICENDNVLPAGVAGNIRVKTLSCFGSYFYADASDDSFKDGYFYTGDIGFLDQDECLFITGRQKDLIKKGGLSISGNFISSIIKEVPGVIEAYTMGTRDAIVGEEIYSFFVSGTEVSDEIIRSFLRKKIAANLMPKKIFRLDTFPVTATGKIRMTDMELVLKNCLDG